jgi:hypothetical protein
MRCACHSGFIVNDRDAFSDDPVESADLPTLGRPTIAINAAILDHNARPNPNEKTYLPLMH